MADNQRDKDGFSGDRLYNMLCQIQSMPVKQPADYIRREANVMEFLGDIAKEYYDQGYSEGLDAQIESKTK